MIEWFSIWKDNNSLYDNSQLLYRIELLGDRYIQKQIIWDNHIWTPDNMGSLNNHYLVGHLIIQKQGASYPTFFLQSKSLQMVLFKLWMEFHHEQMRFWMLFNRD